VRAAFIDHEFDEPAVFHAVPERGASTIKRHGVS